MTMVIWIWGLALIICSLAFLIGVAGIVYALRGRRTKTTGSALLTVMLLATIVGLGGAITAVSRLLQFLYHA